MILSFVKPSTRLEHRSSNAAPVQGHSSREAKFRDALCGLRFMKYQKPDGVIEIAGSACSCVPGTVVHRQHTNCGTNWWRVDEGEWMPLPRSSGTARIYAECANTCAEFLKTMTEMK